MWRPSNVGDPLQATDPADDTRWGQRTPDNIKRSLRTYIDTLRRTFPQRVYAVSLYGSAALGGFSERTSDVDFLTVIVGHITEDDRAAIRALHSSILHADAWMARFDGEYAELDQIRQGELGTPALFVHRGALAGRREVSRASWSTLIQCGISVLGPPPAAFVPEVAWADLEQEMWCNLREYWTPRAQSRLLFFSSSWAAFAVLTLCRIIYTLHFRSITSKPAAAAYALSILPVDWHRLIREAVRLHEDPATLPLYRSRLMRALDVQRFIPYVVQYCDNQSGVRSSFTSR